MFKAVNCVRERPELSEELRGKSLLFSVTATRKTNSGVGFWDGLSKHTETICAAECNVPSKGKIHHVLLERFVRDQEFPLDVFGSIL